jgi:hypothetical protein
MELEQIQFGWYMKTLSALAGSGYVAGAGAYLLQCRPMQ